MSGFPHTVHFALLVTESFLESQVKSAGCCGRACESDRGPSMPGAPLKLDTGPKTGGVAKHSGCLAALWLWSSLGQCVWVTTGIYFFS